MLLVLYIKFKRVVVFALSYFVLFCFWFILDHTFSYKQLGSEPPTKILVFLKVSGVKVA